MVCELIVGKDDYADTWEKSSDQKIFANVDVKYS